MGHLDRTRTTSSIGVRLLSPAVVTFSGKIGSGKSEISSALASRLRWPLASFGDYLRSIARVRGLSESREVLQGLGESLVAGDVHGFCKAVLSQANWVPAQGLVVDGVRHSEVASTLRELVAPLPLLLVLVEVPDVVRGARLFKKGVEYELLRELDLHSTESQVSSTLPHIADLKIDGTRKPDQLVEEIVDCLRRRLGGN